MGFVQNVKNLPIKSKRLLALGILTVLVLTLPLFVWAILTQRLDVRKRASSGEISICNPVNKIINVTPYDQDGTCHDIQTAIDAVDGSDYTISIQSGQYNIERTINVENKQNLKITGDPNSKAAINFTESGGWGFYVNNSSVYFDYLNMQGNNNGIIVFNGSNNIGVRHSNINLQSSSVAIGVHNSSNLLIHDSGIIGGDIGLEMNDVNNATIISNKFTQGNHAIVLRNIETINIGHNTIAANKQSAITIYADAESINIDHNTMENNTSIGKMLSTIHFFYAMGSNINLTNNIFSHNYGSALKVENSNVLLDLQKNMFWQNLGGDFIGTENVIGVNGNLSADPLLYFGYEAPMYCLLPGSPAIYGDVSNGEFMGSMYPCEYPDGSSFPSNNPINWVTSDVSITADNFKVISNGKVYYGNDQSVNVIPGLVSINTEGERETSIEIRSNQHGDDLRMKIYFKTDGSTWYVSSVGILNTNYSQNWISFNGPMLTTPIGIDFYQEGSHFFTLIDPNTNQKIADVLYSGLKIGAFTNIYTTPDCERKPLSVEIEPTWVEGKPGETKRINVRIINNDEGSCTPYNLHLVSDKPSNWQSIHESDLIVLYQGDSKLTYFDIIPPTENYLLGDQQIPVRINSEEIGTVFNSYITYNLLESVKVGDVNKDGSVNMVDLGIIIDHYGSSPATDSRADLNNDGVINIVDIGILVDNYGS